MGDFLSIVRLALDRGWAFGGLLAIFFAAILGARSYGVEVPETLQQWSAVGVLFGIAVLLVSMVSHAARGAANLFRHLRFRFHLRNTLRELTQAEKAFLRPFVIEGENTYASINDGVANGLQGKGIVYRASNLSLPGVPGMLFP